MAEHLARGVKEAAALLAQAEYCIALTGAGVSTESGIPDFRSPGSGLWTRLDPMFFTIESFKADPAQFYRLGQELFAVIKGGGTQRYPYRPGRTGEAGPGQGDYYAKH